MAYTPGQLAGRVRWIINAAGYSGSSSSLTNRFGAVMR
jgi:hypothetical protein